MKIRLVSKILRKMILITLVIIMQGIFLYAYYDNQDFISFFRVSYLTDIYIPIYAQKTNGASKYLASVVQFNKNHGNSEPQNKRENATSIPVLLYHGVVDNWDDANILLEDFRNQMFALKKAGWQTINIEDFYKFMRGEKELPDKSFLLTFDDGRKDSYYSVDPILKALDYRATIFVITERSLGEDNNKSNFHLSKNELKRMAKSGRWDIQAHTKEGHDFYKIDAEGNKGHFYSNKLWLENKQRIETEEEFKKRITEDLNEAKNDIKENLEIDSLSFAFPFGDFGQESVSFPQAESVILNTVKEIYPISFYQIWPGKDFSFNYPKEEQFLMKRIEVRPYWNSDNLLKVLDIAKDKNLPYFDNFSGYDGWIKNYGQLSIENNLMIIESNFSEGGSVFLDGSYLWKNYILKVKADWIKGKVVSLMARFKDDKNYVSCSFNDKKIRIEQNLNGKKRIMAEKEIPFEIPKENLELGIAVDRDKINCLIDGKSAIYSYYLSPVLSNGGIGFKTWDKEVNNSKIAVKEVKVEEIKSGENLVFMAISEKTKTEEVKDNFQKEKFLQKKEKQQEKNGESTIKEETKQAGALILPTILINAPPEEIKKPVFITPVFLPYFIKEFDTVDGWKSLWGDYFVKNSLLHISSGNLASGFTVFEKSLDWENYFFKTKLDWLKGESFSLVARYKDSKNYTACSFSNYGKYASIYNTVNGETKLLGKTGGLPVPYFTPWLNLNFGVKVNGNEIECLINDNWALKNKIETMPYKGGIGFKIWGYALSDNEAEIKEISVEEIK